MTDLATRPEHINERLPGDFQRNAGSGSPMVLDPTQTKKPSGKKADLVAACTERGIEMPAKVTVKQLKEMLDAAGAGSPKRVTYGRPSGFGKQIENATNLQKWIERMVALGTVRLAIAGEIGPHVADVDPDSKEGRATLDALAVDAKKEAKADLAAARGTHTHELTEDNDHGHNWLHRADAGDEIGLPIEAQAAMVAVWNQMVEANQLTIIEIEAKCVDDRWRLAGTLDRIATLNIDLTFVCHGGELVTVPAGTTLILDVKTGKLRTDAGGHPQYWHGYAIQLASYGQSVPYDPDTDTRGEWSYPIDQKYAIIAHIDVLAALDGEAKCRLVLVDLEAGREAGDLVVLAKAWERRADVFSLVGPSDAVFVEPVEYPESSIPAQEAPPCTSVTPIPVSSNEPTTSSSSAPTSPPSSPPPPVTSSSLWAAPSSEPVAPPPSGPPVTSDVAPPPPTPMATASPSTPTAPSPTPTAPSPTPTAPSPSPAFPSFAPAPPPNESATSSTPVGIPSPTNTTAPPVSATPPTTAIPFTGTTTAQTAPSNGSPSTSTATTSPTSSATSPPDLPEHVAVAYADTHHEQLVELANLIGEWPDEIRNAMAHVWPNPDVLAYPGQVRDGTATWTGADLPLLAQLLRHAEAPFNIYTEPTLPGEPSERGFIDQPAPVTGRERVERPTVDLLVDRIRESSAKETVNRWVSEGHHAGVAWSPLATPNMRAFEICRAALRLAEVMHGDADDVALELIYLCGLNPVYGGTEATTVGEALGNCTVRQATAVHEAADRFSQGFYTLTYNAAGRPELTEVSA